MRVSTPLKEIGIHHREYDDYLLLAQKQDDRLKYVYDVLKRDPSDNEECEIHKLYAIKNKRIYRKTDSGLLWAVPRALQQQITRLCLDEMGHMGAEKTLNKMRIMYWFAAMRRYVKRYCSSCLSCFYYKEQSGRKLGYLYNIKKVAKPLHSLHVDHLDSIVKSAR